MVVLVEVLGSSKTLLNIHVLMFAYLLPCKIGTNVCAEILGNKKLLALMECPKFSFLENQQLYRHEVFIEASLQILQLVISSEMVCLNIFDERVFKYVCLVSPTHGS
jgi:hypothetical protein